MAMETGIYLGACITPCPPGISDSQPHFLKIGLAEISESFFAYYVSGALVSPLAHYSIFGLQRDP